MRKPVFWVSTRFDTNQAVMPQIWLEVSNFRFTVKFLNFQKSENFAEIVQKLEKKKIYHRVMHPKDADSIANSEDPDQTAPLGAV